MFHYKDATISLQLPHDSILFVRSQYNKTLLVTNENSYILNYTIDCFLEEINSNQFIKTHRLCAVNTAKINKIYKNCLYVDNTRIGLSANRHEAFIAYIKTL
jgi:DNA-binding LytR/AlgR family response regulator